MSAPMLDTVATGGGGRFDSTADPATVLDAVRRGVAQVCQDQLSAEVKRLRPALDSGTASESAAALGAASLVLAEAAAVVGEAEAALRLGGLADDEATWWPSRRALLEQYIQQSRVMAAGLERDSPEQRRLVGPALLTVMTLVSGIASNFCSTPAYLARPASTPGYLTRRASYLIRPASTSASVVDDLASGIDDVQTGPVCKCQGKNKIPLFCELTKE